MGMDDFDGMSVNELWQLHLDVVELLTKRLTSQKLKLEGRLTRLEGGNRNERRPRRDTVDT